MDPRGTVLDEADIYVEDGLISAVAPDQPPFNLESADQTIQAKGCNVLPGFVNAHGHVSLGLMRGLGEFIPGLSWEHYFDRQGNLTQQLTEEDYYLGAQLLIAEMIRAGITSFADIHFEGPGSKPITDLIAQAVESCGIRAVLCLETSGYLNIGGTHMIYSREETDRSYQHSRAFINKWQGKAGGRITTMLGLGDPPVPTRYDMELVAQGSSEAAVPIQMHVAEIPYEMEEWQKIYKKRPFEMLLETGILDHHVLGGNVVFMDKHDAAIVKDHSFHASTCPKNCCKMSLGMLDIPMLIALGVNVCLGTNEMANNNRLDMIEEMRMAALYHKMQQNDPYVLSGDLPLRLVTEHSGRALGTGAGVLAHGRPADIIIMDRKNPHMHPDHDPLANVIYSSSAADTRTVMIAGRVIMQDGKLLTFDDQTVIEQLERSLSSKRVKIPAPYFGAGPASFQVKWEVDRSDEI